MGQFKHHQVEIEEISTEQVRLAEMMRETEWQFGAVLDDIRNHAKAVQARMQFITEQVLLVEEGKGFTLSYDDGQPQAARDLQRLMSKMDTLRDRLRMERHFALETGATDLRKVAV